MFRGFGACSRFVASQAMLLLNHAFAHVTPAIFVIFVIFTGSEQQSPSLLLRTRIRHFRRFGQKPPLSWQGTKARFNKSTAFATLRQGAGGQRWLVRGNPFYARDTGLISAPFFLCPSYRVRRVESTPDPNTFENYRDTPPQFYRDTFAKYALLLAESSIYTTNLYHDTPPICIAILLQKY